MAVPRLRERPHERRRDVLHHARLELTGVITEVCEVRTTVDVTSYLPYADSRLSEIKLAMRIGREYLARKITRADWSVEQ